MAYDSKAQIKLTVYMDRPLHAKVTRMAAALSRSTSNYICWIMAREVSYQRPILSGLSPHTHTQR